MGKYLGETIKGADINWTYEWFVTRVKVIEKSGLKIVDKVGEWSFAVLGSYGVTMIMYSGEEPMGIMELKMDQIGDGQEVRWVSWSITNPKFPKSGLGTRMYLWALKKYGPIMSGNSQSTAAHALWSKLARTSDIEVVGWDMYEEERVEVKPAGNGFIVQSTGKEVHGDDDIHLIMYWGKANLHEIERLSFSLGDHGFIDHVQDIINLGDSEWFGDKGDGWKWRWRVVDDGTYTGIVMYSSRFGGMDEPAGIMRLTETQISQSKSFLSVDWSLINPKFRGVGLGERMYLWVLEKYGPIMSDKVQTDASHKLWKRLQKHSAIKMWGINTAEGNEFPIELNGSEIVNANDKTPVFTDYPEAKKIRLVMSWGGKGLSEIRNIGDDLGGDEEDFMWQVETIMGKNPKWVDDGEWRYAVNDTGNRVSIVMHQGEVPMGVIELDSMDITMRDPADEKYSPKFKVIWSELSPERRGSVRGLGERMYLFAVKKYGPIASDGLQTDSSHKLWARLGKNSAITMWGLDMNDDGNGELIGEIFAVKSNGSKVVNALGRKPVVYGHESDTNVLLVMSLGGSKVNEIDDTISEINKIPVMNVSKSGFNSNVPSKMIDEPVDLFAGRRFRMIGNESHSTIVMYDADDTPIGILNLKKYQGHMAIVLSAKNPETRERGVGEIMYLYALGKYGSLMSDRSQTQKSHDLWIRLASNPGITVIGYDPGDKRDGSNPKKFPVKVDGNKFVNAHNDKSIFIDHDDDHSYVRLIMYSAGHNVNEILKLNSRAGKFTIKVFEDMFSPLENKKPDSSSTDGWIFRTGVYNGQDLIGMYDKNNTPMAIIRLDSYRGKYKYVAFSCTRPDVRGSGLGTIIYLYTLNKYRSLISDKFQTEMSHGLWAKLLRTGQVRMRGFNTDTNEFFNVKIDPNDDKQRTIVNADSDEPIVFGNNDKTVLMMFPK